MQKSQIIPKFSLYTFFTQGCAQEWFIAAIIVLYIAFPLFYYFAKSQWGFILSSICFYMASLAVCFLPFKRNVEIVFELFVVRIPSFVFGIFCALLIKKKSDISVKMCYLVYTFVISFFGGLSLLYFKPDNYLTYSRILFLPLVFSVCMLLSKNHFISKKGILAALGGITLELYLTHEKLVYVMSIAIGKIISNAILQSIIANILAVIISVLVCFIYKYLYNKFVDFLKHIFVSKKCKELS